MTFVDISKPNGAAARYGTNIPADEISPRNSNIAKKELIWNRLDIFFYSGQEYQKPKGVNSDHVITVDNYPAYTGECSQNFGDARAKIVVPGYFSVLKEDGLKPNEYTNELLMHCGKVKVKLNEVKTLSSNEIIPIHYLVPVIDPEVIQATDIMYFNSDNDNSKNGWLQDYPEVRFTYAHRFNFTLEPNNTRQGGMIEIDLKGVGFKSGVDPIADNLITYSVDHIGFNETRYDKDSSIIRAYFKRGLMPNEAYGKGVI